MEDVSDNTAERWAASFARKDKECDRLRTRIALAEKVAAAAEEWEAEQITYDAIMDPDRDDYGDDSWMMFVDEQLPKVIAAGEKTSTALSAWREARGEK